MFTFKRTLLATAMASVSVLSPLSFAQTLPDGSLSDDIVNSDLEVIVISGTKTEKALKDVAGSISVISEEDIEKQAVNSMNQLFKYDPSIQVSGSVGGAQNFIVRGMGGDRVLMIKDGMRMNEGYGADGLNDIVGRGFIETDILKQVEVAKGAASSLYGSDALGGIVVFTTKDASDYLSEGDKVGGKIKFGYDDQGKQSSVAGTLALETGAIEHLLNISLRDGEEAQSYDNTKPSLDIESKSFFYKGKYNINDNDYLSLTVDQWNQDVKGDIAYGLLEYFRDLEGYTILDESSKSEQDNRSIQLRYHSETKTAFYDLLSVSIYSNDTEQNDVEYGQLDIDANFGFPIVEIRDMWKSSIYKQETQGFLSHASKTLNQHHTLGYGLDVEDSTSTRTEMKLYAVEGEPKPGYPQESEKFPTTDVFRAGFFINDEISLLNDTLIVTPGARFDQYEMDPNGALKEDGEAYKKFDESNISLNIGALYKFSDTVAAFAQYGQGFKVPAYDLAYINHDNSLYGYKIVPSDDLAPEESNTFELGLRGHVDDFFFSAAVFYSKYDNFLATQLIDIESQMNPYTGQESQVLVYQYQNIDAVTIKGIEASLRYHVNDNFSVFTNASYQDGENKETGDYLESISPLSGVTGISFEQESLSADLILNWAASMNKVNDGNVALPGYGAVDLLVSYAFNDQLKVNFAATNLTDKKYVRYVNGAGHADSSTLEDVTEAGRSISANISYQF
ncbi:TonB-dependent hemoglobin/transferrin/lactoferrin family receptor [Thalassotalea sp. PLHSN55]|uniref:TonB-dependent hemoglobin/transferrin/lactoferrin family receptor n=1 Tax=Thalassotalea sp. PLHSN55 TaxID=3435888 RepID=UPI003F825E9A